MNPMPTTPSAAHAAATTAPQEMLSQGDARWDRAPQPWRERTVALPWPLELLGAFTLRMGSHGMSVSQAMMMCDRSYALRQLKDAHDMADDDLRALAVQLFRHFEAWQSGIRAVH